MAYIWFVCFLVTLALLISAIVDIVVLRDELATYRRKATEDSMVYRASDGAVQPSAQKATDGRPFSFES